MRGTLRNERSPPGSACCAKSSLLLIFVEALLVACLFGLVATSLVCHIHDEYWEPCFQTLIWTEERKAKEITYYKRSCDERDVSTYKASDLYLSVNATADEAYWHQLRHGFTVIRQVLTPNTSHALRNHILARNPKMGKEYSVLDNENRYSFGLTSEDPIVATMLKEVANHRQLSEAMEAIVGADSAMVELTAITASYGAIDQDYHDDVNPETSASLYARSFVPLYSLFVPLQDTTKDMGATGVCPGTHFCGDDNKYDVCTEHGFQLVEDENGYWTAGDALIMTMNVLHRGTANTQPGADRVMIILTFGPKPRAVAESRQLSMGSTLSIRWDMWGHTWRDLQHADSMKFPWHILRALGIYKRKGLSQGYDFISSTYMRIANDPLYWTAEGLEVFLRTNPLPRFLQPSVEQVDLKDDHAWFAYIRAVLWRSQVVAVYTVCTMAAVYLLSVGGALATREWAAKGRASLLRVFVVGLAACCFGTASRNRIDATHWATDVRLNRLYASTVDSEVQHGVRTTGPTTLPTRHDVLFENRLSGSGYNVHKDQVNIHPGNQRFQTMVNAASPAAPLNLVEEASTYIFDSIGIMHGRFVEQGYHGRWFVLTKDEALQFIRRAILNEYYVSMKNVHDASTRMKGELRFGVYGSSALSSKHALPFLQSVENKLYRSLLPKSSCSNCGDESAARRRAADEFRRRSSSTGAQSNFRLQKPEHASETIIRGVPSRAMSTEAKPGDWIQSGSLVEAAYVGFWYAGVVTWVNAQGEYEIAFEEEALIFQSEHVRRFQPYEIGEEIEYLVPLPADEDEQDEFLEIFEGTVFARLDDGTYHVVLNESGEVQTDVKPTEVRRPLQQDHDVV